MTLGGRNIVEDNSGDLTDGEKNMMNLLEFFHISKRQGVPLGSIMAKKREYLTPPQDERWVEILDSMVRKESLVGPILAETELSPGIMYMLTDKGSKYLYGE